MAASNGTSGEIGLVQSSLTMLALGPYGHHAQSPCDHTLTIGLLSTLSVLGRNLGIWGMGMGKNSLG